MKRSHLAAAAAVLLLALPFAPVPDFWITQLNYIGLFSLVVLGLVLLTGVGGLTSFGQAAFAGVGAYATAYLTTVLGLSPWLGLVAGLGITLVLALVIGALTLRMSGHYLPLATICWCLALYYLVGNLDALGKYDGLLGLPAVTLGDFSFQSERRIYLLIWLAALLAALGVTRLLDSRPGRIMRALNTNRGGGSTMPEAMGASTFRYKLVMFVVAALLASVSGWLYAHMQRSVNPSPFGIKFGIEYLFMAVLGGIGTVGGAFAGAALVKLAEDQLQAWLPVIFGGSGNYEIIVFGVVLVLVLRFAPDGLWPLIARWLPARGRRAVDENAPRLSARSHPEGGAALLDVRRIRKQFGGLVAVNDISFAIRAGDIVGLIGPNGAGKSTTFNLVSGVLPLTAGEVKLLGQRVDGRGSRDIARAGLSRTFQHVKLVPDMTVLENVALGCYLRTRSGTAAAMLGLDRAEEMQARAEALRQLRRIGLAGQAHELAGNLALGPQRLVEIARALASDPSLLLLDEPAAGLRHKEKEALAEVLKQLKAEGLSLLLVEHDMDFVMKLTDRIVVMEFGRHLMEGTPAEVQASPAVRAAYLGADE
ncbi:ABC transporter permease subunit [Roseateles saccharophilus]|uniref:Amino acid/amide ABC transporter membrane protein 2 (HAAT family) /amino acid/amide ABC transporter ATP-binding protein 1 (HAAT family) n=1 Tax=Roseateles saccharophilus TaxID=304 RepID=A0A4R3VBW0_ROSSA|nr:branched-chain amino acid ABC transporter ATP-binding protein/permease [Roseateles saccharophilus]MDG0835920.1 branched-chain amino acid ABC transporter ATP-binding protein/permease [Roseateles saccharophilus]TCV01112.1 amino acid/amide ABC transporter membrane protein 2 (HAAT family) /amino acid/amide ABC transporter ATP-binding protein 1 (HAAT family) [Roseateles saccharophilus]